MSGFRRMLRQLMQKLMLTSVTLCTLWPITQRYGHRTVI